MKKIVIVGAGDGGTLTANELRKILNKEFKKKEVSITVIDRKEMHEFQPASLYVAFKGHDPNKYKRPQEKLFRKGITWVREFATKIDLDNRKVTTESGKAFDYDYLVIATGSVADDSLIPGLGKENLDYHSGLDKAAKIWPIISTIKKGTLVFGMSNPTYKCPPSPMEGALLADELLRKRKVRDSVTIKFVTPLPRVYPVESVDEIVSPIFEERNIEVISFFNIDHIDSEKKIIYSMEGDELSFDYTFLVPPHRGPDVITKSGIGTDDGWVKVDKHLLNMEKHKEVFAVGDVADLPTAKTGVTAHLEALVASKNIVCDLRGCGDHWECWFTGRTNCPFEVGFGKATFVQTTYDKPAKKLKPTRIRYLMKKLFLKTYWMSLKGTFDFIFSIYFGKDEKHCFNKQEG